MLEGLEPKEETIFGAVWGKTSYRGPSIVLDGLQPKEAKESKCSSVQLPKEETFSSIKNKNSNRFVGNRLRS